MRNPRKASIRQEWQCWSRQKSLIHGNGIGRGREPSIQKFRDTLYSSMLYTLPAPDDASRTPRLLSGHCEKGPHYTVVPPYIQRICWRIRCALPSFRFFLLPIPFPPLLNPSINLCSRNSVPDQAHHHSQTLHIPVPHLIVKE